MKWYKKVILGFLFLLLVNLITIFVVSINMKRIIINGIITETIREKISNQEWKQANEIDLDEEIDALTEDERLREILKSPEMQELINKYLEITITNMTEDESLEEVEIEKDVLNFLKENKEELSQAVGQEITEDMITKTEEQLQGKDLTKYFKQTVINTKRHLTEREKKVLKGYKILTSQTFHIIIFVLIVAVTSIIGLIEWSWHKWINYFGKAMLVSGILTILMGLISKIVVSSKAPLAKFDISILYINGSIILGIGLGIILLYSLMMQRKEHKIWNTQNF